MLSNVNLFVHFRFPTIPLFYPPNSTSISFTSFSNISTSEHLCIPNQTVPLGLISVRLKSTSHSHNLSSWTQTSQFLLVTFSSGDILLLTSPPFESSTHEDQNDTFSLPSTSSTFSSSQSQFSPTVFLPVIFLHSMRIAASTGVSRWSKSCSVTKSLTLSSSFKEALLRYVGILFLMAYPKSSPVLVATV